MNAFGVMVDDIMLTSDIPLGSFLPFTMAPGT
jgi:hypothetical protein